MTGASLLPGRSLLHRLYPLTLVERPAREAKGTPSFEPLVPLPGKAGEPLFPPATLIDRLAYGELPGIALAPERDRADLLRSYAYVYLEEELRREALIKSWPTFARFLRLAALESGQMLNYAKIAREAGTSLPTVKSHYQLLETCSWAFTVTGSRAARGSTSCPPRVSSSSTRVRHAAAQLVPGRTPSGESGLSAGGDRAARRLQYLRRGG